MAPSGPFWRGNGQLERAKGDIGALGTSDAWLGGPQIAYGHFGRLMGCRGRCWARGATGRSPVVT
jgi:hypothetical protein